MSRTQHCIMLMKRLSCFVLKNEIVFLQQDLTTPISSDAVALLALLLLLQKIPFDIRAFLNADGQNGRGFDGPWPQSH